MLAGNVNLPNVEGASTFEQAIQLPPNAIYLLLSFRYLGTADGPLSTGDLQYVDLIDAATNQRLERLLQIQNYDNYWQLAQKDLTPYSGRAVKLVFGVSNNGVDGRLAMYVDDVSLTYCPNGLGPTPTTWATPTPTQTPWPTPWPTPFPTVWTPYVTPTPFPTTVAPSQQCTDILRNGSFEEAGTWEFGRSPVPAVITASFGNLGARSAQLGNPPGYRPDVESYSSIRQLVTIPANVGSAQLRWWAIFGSQEPFSDIVSTGSDRQELILLNPDLSTRAVLFRIRRIDRAIQQITTDLTPFIGQTFNVYFNVFNDGNGLQTWMQLDGIQLCVNTGPIQTPGTNPTVPPGGSTMQTSGAVTVQGSLVVPRDNNAAPDGMVIPTSTVVPQITPPTPVPPPTQVPTLTLTPTATLLANDATIAPASVTTADAQPESRNLGPGALPTAITLGGILVAISILVAAVIRAVNGGD